eukprot:s125_g5.t1
MLTKNMTHENVKFKLEMNWNQEELEQWAIAARQKEEDELTLEKYRRADDSKECHDFDAWSASDAPPANMKHLTTFVDVSMSNDAHCCHIKPSDPDYGQFKGNASHMVPGWAVVDLDLPPEQRWAAAMKDAAEPLKKMITHFKSLVGVLSEELFKLIEDSPKFKRLAEQVLTDMGEYGLEMRGIANATGIPEEEILFVNMMYEIEGGCTSIVAQDADGHVVHGRTGDAPNADLRPLLRNIHFVRGKASLYDSTVFLGYVGSLTAVKKGGFSVTVNTRYDSTHWAALLAFLEGKGSGNFLSLLLREVFVHNTTYSEALDTIRSAKLLGPAYVIVGGTARGEGAILERSATSVVGERLLADEAAKGRNSVVETNWDFGKDPFFDNRRSPAEHCLSERFNENITFSGLFSVLAARPNRNRLTTYTALMSAERHGSKYRLRVRELTLTVEKLTVENANRRKELDDLVTDTQAKQIEMDKTAELFRQLHDDRKKIIEQWEESVKNMKSRDSQLERLGEEYAANMTRKKVKEDKMKERKQFHDEVEADDEKLEQSIQQTDRQLVRMRMDHMEAKTSLTGFKDEVEVMKNQVIACHSEKNRTANEHQVGATRLEGRREKHEQAYRQLEMHKRALQEHQDTTRNKEQMSQDAERARQEMINNMKMVEKEMKAAKESHYKESQELYRLRAEEATTLGAISGAQSAIKNLQLQISKLDQERQRQQELLYAVDFQSQLMQRKVARVSGERTIEEKEEFNRKVEQLDKQLEEQKSLHTILSAQIKRQD